MSDVWGKAGAEAKPIEMLADQKKTTRIGGVPLDECPIGSLDEATAAVHRSGTKQFDRLLWGR